MKFKAAAPRAAAAPPKAPAARMKLGKLGKLSPASVLKIKSKTNAALGC